MQSTVLCDFFSFFGELFRLRNIPQQLYHYLLFLLTELLKYWAMVSGNIIDDLGEIKGVRCG